LHKATQKKTKTAIQGAFKKFVDRHS